MVPALVVHCTNEVENRGLSEVGIYRVPGSEKDVKELKVLNLFFCYCCLLYILFYNDFLLSLQFCNTTVIIIQFFLSIYVITVIIIFVGIISSSFILSPPNAMSVYTKTA